MLQALLRERVPIRDLEVILETVADLAPRTKDTEILAEYARNALARTLCHQHKADDGRIHCITLDPGLEQVLIKGIERTEQGTTMTIPPPVQSKIVQAIRTVVERATTQIRGKSPVILTAPQVRAWVRRMIEVQLPTAAVLSYNEIVRGFEVESHGTAALTDES